MDDIEKAFNEVPRANFLPDIEKSLADYDMALPIGYGQTNSQPYTVKQMLTWLDVKREQKILDVGSGSGWTTALLSNLVGNNGRVYAVELVPELVEFGKENCIKSGVSNAEYFEAGRLFGLPKYAPYDRILVSAAIDKIPPELIDQLKTNGKIVIPIYQDILEITKLPKGDLKTVRHSGYVFVPLLNKS